MRSRLDIVPHSIPKIVSDITSNITSDIFFGQHGLRRFRGCGGCGSCQVHD
jgi:hypothetical protein